MSENLKTRLHVLVISSFPRKGIVVGGVQSAVYTLTTALASHPEIAAIEVIDFSNDVEEHETVTMSERLKVHYVPGQKRLNLPSGAALNYLKARRIAKAFRPDIVHGQEPSMQGDIAIRLGYPTVVTIHGILNTEARLLETNRIVGPLRTYLVEQRMKRVLRRAKVVISISEYAKNELAGYLPSTVIDIPNAVRPEFFDCGPPPHDEKHILFAGRLVLMKNVAGLVRAFAQVKRVVPEAILHLAGPLDDRLYVDRIANDIRTAGIDGVVLHGNVSSNRYLDLMRQSSLVVLFSNQENLPCVIAEALASGRPVVSSAVGGIPEMVEDGCNGYLVPAGDEEALAARIITLLQEPELLQTMGRRGRELAIERWDPQTVAEGTVRAYQLALRTQ